MIYNSLEILPIKVFLKILETSNVRLLSTSIVDVEKLHKTWEELYDNYRQLDPTNQTTKTFKLSQKIEGLVTKYKSVKIAVDCLKTKADTDLVAMLKSHGYKISNSSFDNDLEKIERESEALLLRAETFKKQLPKEKNPNEITASIDDVLASYSLVLGFDVGDYNKISVTKFFALQNQVKLKIKSLEKNG